jgi:hypothetical protein
MYVLVFLWLRTHLITGVCVLQNIMVISSLLFFVVLFRCGVHYQEEA